MQNDARGVGLPINQTITLSRIADSVDPKLRSCTCPPFILLGLFVPVDLKRSDHALVPPSWGALNLFAIVEGSYANPAVFLPGKLPPGLQLQ